MKFNQQFCVIIWIIKIFGRYWYNWDEIFVMIKEGLIKGGYLLNSITKRIAALGVSCALAISPIASLKVKANTNLITAKLQSVSNFEKTVAKEQEAKFSDDTFIIKYSSPLSSSEHQKAGGTVIQQISGLKYVAVKVKDKDKLQQTIQNYQKNSKVVSVNLSPKYKQEAIKDPKISEQYIHKLLNTAEAQKLAGKHQVKVAVIDTGIDRNHPELKGSILSSTNIINPMNPTTADIHGTHVAGIIAAKKNNGIGGFGMDPNAKILSYDVFDGDMWTFDYTIANAILEAVDQGANVINMSLGGSTPSSVLQEAVDKAINSGVVVVAAAGNDGMDMPSYPASYEGVISVGSVNSDKKLSEFSTYGASTDVVAPGENVYAPYYDVKKGSTFERLSGTSMASPAVAGAAALLLTQHPKLTPAEVEYILEKTASDLGEKGFDKKYGNGLINPLAAMKFDVKKIPSLVTNKWDKEEILANAESITLPTGVEHSFTKPSEQKWVKFPVEKGEYIQASVVSSSQYDYKLSIHFYSDNQEQLIDINDVKEGKTEAKLIQAPFSGTVAIGVKDVNGSYDDSINKQSTFTLQLDKVANLSEDESTLKDPLEIASLPFNQSNLYVTGEKGDEDFFHFTSREAQFMKFDVTGIPGVDINASVFEKDQLFSSVGEEGLVDIPPLYSANNGGIGEGETLSFQTEPNKEYYIKVTNKISFSEYGFTNILNGISYSYAGETKKEEPAQSMLPYSVSLEGKVIPADEDNYSGEMSSKKEETINNSVISYQEEEEKRIALLETVALPYEIGGTVKGYLQKTMDEDWFKLNPTHAGIYQFDLPTPSINIPTVELYELAEDKDEKGKSYRYLSYVTSNIATNWYSWSDTYTNSFKTGLKANKTYFLAVKPNYSTGQIPYDGYEITSKLLVENTGDALEVNDLPEQAKNLPVAGVKANFSTPNDVDTYYFTAKKTETYGVKFSRTELTTALKNEYGEELLSPFYGYIVITEDVNKNRKAEENDLERTKYIINMTEDGTTTGSFKAKKGQSYFVMVYGNVESSSGLTLWPYQLNIDSVNKKDEDAGSKVKNYIPSKPIALKKNNSKLYTAKAYLNAGYENGDEDWFIYKSQKTENATLTLDAGQQMDGVIEVFKNGKNVAKSDYYGKGDNEIMSLKMTKGTYYIKVRDAQGHTSFNPYTLSLKLQ